MEYGGVKDTLLERRNAYFRQINNGDKTRQNINLFKSFAVSAKWYSSGFLIPSVSTERRKEKRGRRGEERKGSERGGVEWKAPRHTTGTAAWQIGVLNTFLCSGDHFYRARIAHHDFTVLCEGGQTKTTLDDDLELVRACVTSLVKKRETPFGHDSSTPGYILLCGRRQATACIHELIYIYIPNNLSWKHAVDREKEVIGISSCRFFFFFLFFSCIQIHMQVVLVTMSLGVSSVRLFRGPIKKEEEERKHTGSRHRYSGDRDICSTPVNPGYNREDGGSYHSPMAHGNKVVSVVGKSGKGRKFPWFFLLKAS